MKEPKALTPINCTDIDPDKNMISLLDTSILVDVMAGKLDLNKIAFQELRNRGLDLNGKWIGFDKK